MKRILKNVLMSAVIASTSIVTTAGATSTYPDAAVKVIVPYSAGGGSDSVSRALVEALKDKFPEGIAAENRTGGAGAIGMSYAQNSKPDGRTIGMVAPELVMLPHQGYGASLDYKKLMPLAIVNSGYAAITVPVNSPYQTLEDLIKDSKDKNLLFGNSGTGSIWHLAGAGLEVKADTQFTHVPYKGSSAAITALLGNHLDAVSVSYAEVASQVEAGKLRPLAVLAPNRLKDAPNVPTARELGYDVEIGTWRGFMVPKGTPQSTVTFLTDAILEAVETPTFKTFMANTNNDIEIIKSDEFAKKLEREDIFFKELITKLELNQ